MPGGTATVVNGFVFIVPATADIPMLSEWMLLALMATLVAMGTGKLKG